MVSKEPNIRQKQFTYATSIRWTGEKTGIISSGEKDPIEFTSPPEFKGVPGLWTPEELFVGAVEMCQLLTTMALAKRRNIHLISYDSNASGELKFVDGSYRFTGIVVRPTITVSAPATELDVFDLVREAHGLCLISNSISAYVKVEPTIVQEETEVVTAT
jgi:organic hydroperoxide reductase OsmC/OhrA